MVKCQVQLCRLAICTSTPAIDIHVGLQSRSNLCCSVWLLSRTNITSSNRHLITGCSTGSVRHPNVQSCAGVVIVAASSVLHVLVMATIVVSLPQTIQKHSKNNTYYTGDASNIAAASSGRRVGMCGLLIWCFCGCCRGGSSATRNSRRYSWKIRRRGWRRGDRRCSCSDCLFLFGLPI